jgi:hypothetical protein
VNIIYNLPRSPAEVNSEKNEFLFAANSDRQIQFYPAALTNGVSGKTRDDSSTGLEALRQKHTAHSAARPRVEQLMGPLKTLVLSGSPALGRKSLSCNSLL